MKSILVTSFGAFPGHPINSSSEVLNKLQSNLIIKDCNVCFKELPVVYSETKEFISTFWKMNSPNLAVHLGVYTEAFVSVECQCNETEYLRKDINGNVPNDGTWPYMKSNLPLVSIVEKISQQPLSVNVKVSRDAGQYLCQYSFHNSLCYGNGNSVFIHVPMMDDILIEETTQLITVIIEELVALI